MGDSGFEASRYRRFCVGAAVAFLVVTAYNLATKLPAGELGQDWAHTMVHLASALLAWAASRSRTGGARWFTVGLLVFYGLLGVLGWLVDGVALGTPARIPLQAAENLFHLLLALAALTTVVASRRRRPALTGGG